MDTILLSAENKRTYCGFKVKMEESCELKMRAMLGDDFWGDQEITILNRRIVWKEGCLHYEADTKHVSEIRNIPTRTMNRKVLLFHL